MKQHRIPACLACLCLLMTACGKENSKAAESSEISDAATETTAATTETTGGTAAETTTTTVTAEQTADTGAASDTTALSGLTGQAPGGSSGSMGGAAGGGSPGGAVSAASLRFDTPEDAITHTIEMLNSQDAEGLMRAVPEPILSLILEGYEVTEDEVLADIRQMFIELTEDTPDYHIDLTVRGRVTLEEAFRGTENEEESRSDLKEACEEHTADIAEYFGCDPGEVKYEILSVHAVLTEDGEQEEEDDCIPVFYADGRWFDVTAENYVVLAVWGYAT
ncbi:MAG: hypothetical protein IJ060_00745 [Oscillospiraceae bacterium]|nr:hypothetical protein [Oscillospiraceae bacterium]